MVNGCSVVLQCLESKAPGSIGRARNHCSSPACHLHGIAHGQEVVQ